MAAYSPAMRSPILILVVAAALACSSGCKERKPAVPAQQAVLRQAAELDNETLMKMFLESFEKEMYATNVSARFQSNFNEAIVTKLSTQAPGELRRKLETLQRRTNRHPFSEEQLKEALRRKER